VSVVTLIEKAQPPLCFFSNVIEKLCRRQWKGFYIGEERWLTTASSGKRRSRFGYPRDFAALTSLMPVVGPLESALPQ
jgi:hypothetical protein